MSGPFDDLVPQNKPGALGGKGFIYSPPADSLGQQQKAATLQETNLRNSQTAATAAANTRKANAEADIAELNEQEKRQQLLLQNGVPAPGDTTKTGDAYIATLPAGMRPQVISMIEGRTPYPTGAALKNPQVMAITAAAQQADPTYNYANAVTRLKTRQDFTSGMSARNLTAINTALGHLGQLMTDAQALKNTGSPMINAPLNSVRNSVLGSGKFSALQNDVLAVSAELERAFKGNNPTESGIHDWEKSFSANSSPDQFLQGGQAVAKLLTGRLENLGDQYNRGMSRASDPLSFLNPHAQNVLQAITSGDISKIPPTLPSGWDKAPLTSAYLPGDSGNPPPPPGADPSGTGAPKIGPQSPPGSLGKADYSGMVGGPGTSVATMDPNSKLGALAQTYRTVYDPAAASALAGFIRKGAPYQTVSDYAASHGFNPPAQDDYSKAVTFAAQHNGAVNVEADRSVPTTLGERLATSPAASFIAGAGSGATAGLDDVLGRAIGGPGYDANRAALSAANPTADALGNVAGGVAGLLAAPELLARFAPGASQALTAFSKARPGLSSLLGNAAYGGVYGASENPNDPLKGGMLGAITGAGAGYAGSKVARGLSNIIAPDVGNFGPLYEAGVFPTPGQRFGSSGVGGRALNVAEQALQSVPLLGAAPATARQASRDAFQVGAFNNSLGELAPFENINGVNVRSSLPDNVGPGTDAHAFAADQFNNAYDHARSGMQFVPDQQYTQDAAQLAQQVGNGVLRPDQVQQLKSVVNNAVIGRLKAGNGVLSGDAYKAASSDLGSAIQTWGRNPDTAPMADALSDYASIFDNAARRNSDPQAVNLLDSADRGYAQLVRIQRASEMGGAAKDAGTFTPTNYAGAVKQMGGGVRSSAFNQGLALGQDYAQAGLNLSDKLADSGTPTRLGVLGALQGAEGAGLAATGHLGALASPSVLGAFAPYLPGVREITNRLIAPRQYTLPPVLADPLNLAGQKLDDVAPLVGKAVIPGALAYYGSGQ